MTKSTSLMSDFDSKTSWSIQDHNNTSLEHVSEMYTIAFRLKFLVRSYWNNEDRVATEKGTRQLYTPYICPLDFDDQFIAVNSIKSSSEKIEHSLEIAMDKCFIKVWLFNCTSKSWILFIFIFCMFFFYNIRSYHYKILIFCLFLLWKNDRD